VYSLGIHPPIYDRVVHGIAHGQPINEEVHLLDVGPVADLGNVGHDDEVDVKRQPADGENYHHDDHHFDNLRKTHNATFLSIKRSFWSTNKIIL